MKIGFLCVPLTGHLNPMTTLARKLKSRGHQIVFFGFPDNEETVRGAGLEFVPFGTKEYPQGSMQELWRPVSHLVGIKVFEHTMTEIMPGLVETALHQLPGILVSQSVEAMVVDTAFFFGQLAPMHLEIPFVQIWNVLHRDASGSTPPASFSLPFDRSPEGLAQNQAALKHIGSFFPNVLAVAKTFANTVELEIDWDNPTATASKLATVTQTPHEFDFPDIQWPPTFHYAGPLHDGDGRTPVEFAWEQLDGRPLIYASLGSVVNQHLPIYRFILEAVSRFPAYQIVLSIGHETDREALQPLPENTIMVSSAPQLELLKRAALCITHAGLNTVLECLGQGVPMVAIPLAYDQPGAAVRIAYHGVGRFVEVENLTANGLAELIKMIMETPSFLEKARSFSQMFAEGKGLTRAAEIVEKAFVTHAAAVVSS